jgi:hypothetical protein
MVNVIDARKKNKIILTSFKLLRKITIPIIGIQKIGEKGVNKKFQVIIFLFSTILEVVSIVHPKNE